MNTKNFTIASFLALFITFSGISQEITEKNFFNTKKELGGEVVILKSHVKIEAGKSYKIFEIESEENNNYYMDAWMDGVELDGFGSNKYLDYDVLVNNEKQKDKLKPEKNDWRSVSFNGKDKLQKSIKLKKGVNQIAFVCDAHVVPGIDFVCLSKDKDKTKISDEKYKKFKEDIEKEVEYRRTHPIPETDSVLVSLKSGTTLTNPLGDYGHKISLNFRYTTYKYYTFSAGQQVFFTTYAADGYRHVLEVFSSTYPETYSWTDLSSSGLASVNITIPYSGGYYVRVRAYAQETQGLVNLNVNGQYYYSNCAVSGSGVAYYHTTPKTYDYFTSHLTGDSRIWIEDYSSLPGKIRAYNDDYYTSSSHDFNWGYASRVKKDFSMSISAVLVSSYSSYSPLGTCDLYIKLNPLSTYTTGWWLWEETHTPILEAFPNLEANDAMNTAPSSSVYNCASWAGGITNGWFWGCLYANSSGGSCIDDYYGNPYVWSTWESYFGNNPSRYSGAMTFTSTDATSTNGDIAVWSSNGYYSGCTHFSVSNYANFNPHGYDWESKPGGLERIFHPRDALNGSSYGSIFDYFQEDNTKAGSTEELTFAQSVALGLTIVENVELSDDEHCKIDEIKTIYDVPELDLLFDNWLTSLYSPELITNSNPYLYLDNQEFTQLHDYYFNNEEASIAYFAEKLFSDELTKFEAEITSVLFCHFAGKNYGSYLESVKKEWNQNNYTKSGAYIFPDAVNTTKKFVKSLLANEENTAILLDIPEVGLNVYNSHEYLNIYPNPVIDYTSINIKIDENEKVSISIFDMSGKKMESVESNKWYLPGSYEIIFDRKNLHSGMYLCKVQIGDEIASRKIVVK